MSGFAVTGSSDRVKRLWRESALSRLNRMPLEDLGSLRKEFASAYGWRIWINLIKTKMALSLGFTLPLTRGYVFGTGVISTTVKNTIAKWDCRSDIGGDY